ncbi:MAG: hypothetical protein JHC33_12820 [Ignisphaera sp.]|nr:hypothetical protein [Ignisphaera sp.]
MATTPLKTPKGVLNWVMITGAGKEPMDVTKKNKFTATLTLPNDSENCVKLSNIIKDFWSENLPTGFEKRPAKSLGFKETIHKETRESTGFTDFTFSTDVSFPDDAPKVIPTYNAKGEKVELGLTKIGNGSTGVIHGAMGVYEVKAKGKTIDAGVTLYLNAVQIAKLVEFTGGVDADDISDDDEEDFVSTNGTVPSVETDSVEI